MLTDEQLKNFHLTGHVTIDGVLTTKQVEAAEDEIDQWSCEFLETITDEQKQWYLENSGRASLLRKLDNPVFHRPFFRSIAGSKALASLIVPVLGHKVVAFFSQVFCKPPSIGGPKPVHQDNFYFGPDDEDGTLTVWIAIDDATPENGCLFYGDKSHRLGILPHFAPPDEPYNLQLHANLLEAVSMTQAPVKAGGVSLHHGNTFHQSAANQSQRARRAVAIHYVSQSTTLVKPALPYDESVFVEFDLLCDTDAVE